MEHDTLVLKDIETYFMTLHFEFKLIFLCVRGLIIIIIIIIIHEVGRVILYDILS